MSFRRFITVILSAVGALVLGVVLYLVFADLGRHKARIEALVTRQIGRPFAIDGALELRVLPSMSVRAERVRVGTAGWDSEPQMVEVGRLSGNWALGGGTEPAAGGAAKEGGCRSRGEAGRRRSTVQER